MAGLHFDFSPAPPSLLLGAVHQVGEDWATGLAFVSKIEGPQRGAAADCQEKVALKQIPAEECGICQQSAPGHPLGGPLLLQCCHNSCFHTDCLKRWLRRKAVCPMCRADATPFTEVPELATSSWQARILFNEGRFDEALQMQRSVYQQTAALHGADHIDTIRAQIQIANTLASQGVHGEALSIRREILAWFEVRFGREHVDTIKASSDVHLSSMQQDAEEALAHPA